jgi:hypothetical protein
MSVACCTFYIEHETESKMAIQIKKQAESASQTDFVVDGLLSPEDVAGLLKVDTRTLSNWRYQGKGPIFTKMGGIVRYSKFDINNFIFMSRQSMTGTPLIA